MTTVWLGRWKAKVRFGIVLLSLVAVAMSAWTGPARAEPGHWLKAEDAHFIVYGRQSEPDLRLVLANLEIYDATLRQATGTHDDPPGGPKLSVYLVSSTREFVEAFPAGSAGHRGIYIPSPEMVCSIVIFVPTDDPYGLGGIQTVFHEYAHFFMSKHSPLVYPTWYVEGYAEFFAATIIHPDTVEIGAIAGWRVPALVGEHWVPLRTVLFSGVQELPTDDIPNFYGESWLLTHYLVTDKDRNQKLLAYMTALNAGEAPEAAFRKVFAMEPEALDTLIRAYAKGGLSAATIPRPSVAYAGAARITALSKAYDDLILLDVRLKTGVPRPLRDQTLAMIRARAGNDPDDPFAQRVLARAEVALGVPETGLALVDKALAVTPNDPDWLYLEGVALLTQADLTPADRPKLMAEARAALAQANTVRPDDVATLFQYGSSFFGDPGEPSENTVKMLRRAMDLSPQVPVIRIRTAYALMARGAFDEAAHILKAVAYDPHGTSYAQYANALLGYAEQRKPPDADVSRVVPH